MTTLAELQKQWYAEDTGTSLEDANPLTSLIPQIGSLFSPTKVKTSSATAIGGIGSFYAGYPQTSTPLVNDNNIVLIAGILVAGLVMVALLGGKK